MSDLITWLRAQFDVDQLFIDAALTGDPDNDCDRCSRGPSPYDGDRLLADLAAKRAILDIHDPPGSTTKARRWCAYCVEPGKPGLMAKMPCQHLRLLAHVYADRPGYQDQWSPA